jgi:hypothetical protein
MRNTNNGYDYIIRGGELKTKIYYMSYIIKIK